MQNCQIENCWFPATVKVVFIDGETINCCNTHGAEFDPAVIDQCDPIENDLFLTILAKWEEKHARL